MTHPTDDEVRPVDGRNAIPKEIYAELQASWQNRAVTQVKEVAKIVRDEVPSVSPEAAKAIGERVVEQIVNRRRRDSLSLFD